MMGKRIDDVLTEKVDKTIESICDWTQKHSYADDIDASKISEMTSALANLITARSVVASLDVE